MNIEEKRNRCIEFVLITLGVFWSGFVAYGAIGCAEDLGILMGFIGGYMLSAMYCGGYYAINIIKRSPLPVKVLVAFLAFFVMIIAMLGGIFALIPMLIINLVNAVKLSKQLKKEEVDVKEVMGEGLPAEEIAPKKKSRGVIVSVCLLVVFAFISVGVLCAVDSYMDSISDLEEYVAGNYRVSSMTSVVGTRKATGFSKKADMTGSGVTYSYNAPEGALEDVEAYANHLIDNEGFKIGKNENGRISLYKYVGEDDRLDVTISFSQSAYNIEVRFTDR